MYLMQSDLSVGTVGVFAASLARYNEFHICLNALQAPKNNEAESKMYFCVGLEFVRNQNEMVANLHGDWLYLLGDDHTFESNVLMRMLQHMRENPEIEVMVPMVSQKEFPFDPTILHGPVGEGRAYTWKEMTSFEKGVHKLELGDTAGTAGMVIKRSVFERMTNPYFECGQVYRDVICEDVHFASKLEKYGICVYVATDVRLGHMRPCILLPERDVHGTWGMSLQLQGRISKWMMGI